MKCAFLFFGAVCAQTHLYQPYAVPLSSSAVGAPQLDIRGAALPSPSWSGNVQQVIVSEPADSMAAQLTTGAGIFGAALVTGLVGISLAKRQVAPSANRLRLRPAPRARLVMQAATEEKTEPEPPAVEYSEALPFLVRRESLGPKGKYVGDVGFDPLGFTEILPIEWLREAEIKHAREHARLRWLRLHGFLHPAGLRVHDARGPRRP